MSRNFLKIFNISFRYLKKSPSYFLFLSQLIRIYKRNYDKCKILLMSLNQHTIRNPFQYLFIIPSSLISLSLIRAAAGCDLKFYSDIVFVFSNLKLLDREKLCSQNWSIYCYITNCQNGSDSLKLKCWIADMPIKMSKRWNIQEIVPFFFFKYASFCFWVIQKKIFWAFEWLANKDRSLQSQL